MLRDESLYLADIQDCCEKVLKYTAGYTLKDLIHDDRTFDAILRNLEIIGEAAKHISDETKARYPQVKWRKIGDFRNSRLYFARAAVDPQGASQNHSSIPASPAD